MLIFNTILLVVWVSISLFLLKSPKEHTYPNWLTVIIILVVILGLIEDILEAM